MAMEVEVLPAIPVPNSEVTARDGEDKRRGRIGVEGQVAIEGGRGAAYIEHPGMRAFQHIPNTL